jgi:hypothetical protein
VIPRMVHVLGWLTTTYRALLALLRALWFVLRQPRLAPRATCTDTGSRYDDDGLPVVVLRGTAYQRGFQHGHQLRPELHRFRQAAWSYAPIAASDRLGLPNWLARLLIKPQLLLAAASYLPQLAADVRAEIQGIADGAGIPLRDMIVNTVIWEIFASVPGSSTAPLHCSELACAATETAERGPLFGYNYDVISPGDRALVEGFVALFVVTPETGSAYIAPNTVGSVGLNTAMNAYGVTFGWDNSYLRPHVTGARKVTPFMLVLRDVALTATRVTEATSRLREEQRPQVDICVLADISEVGVVELAGVTSAYRTSPIVWSCNRLQSLIHLDYLGRGRRLDGRPERYPTVLQALTRPVTVSDVARVLRDRGAPAGRQIADSNTTFSVIYAPRQQRMWLSCEGAPASHSRLRAYDAQGRRVPGDDIV